MMDSNKIASELVKVARDLSASGKLPQGELKFAEKMWNKGYRIAIQILSNGKDFGDPLYFYDRNHIGPFLREFPSYSNVRVKWSVELSDVFGE